MVWAELWDVRSPVNPLVCLARFSTYFKWDEKKRHTQKTTHFVRRLIFSFWELWRCWFCDYKEFLGNTKIMCFLHQNARLFGYFHGLKWSIVSVYFLSRQQQPVFCENFSGRLVKSLLLLMMPFMKMENRLNSSTREKKTPTHRLTQMKKMDGWMWSEGKRLFDLVNIKYVRYFHDMLYRLLYAPLLIKQLM